ncbi:MAG: YHS domain-containing (seleno)protein [Devosia sp.]
MRQIGKQILTIVAWLLLASAALAQDGAPPVVTDPLSGVAIEGYDAVSYFIEPEPRQGVPDYEYAWGGVSWYFVSAANRDVFARNPSTYAPQYGGHCVMSLSRGYLSDGKPRLFFIEALKLYLFYSTANRDAFLLSKSEALTTAKANWENLSKGLPVDKPEEPVPSAEAAVPVEAAPVAPDTADDNVPGH